MKKLTYVTTLLLLISGSSFAQQYTGKFKHKPSLTEFEQFIVVHDAVTTSEGDVLSVKAFGKEGEMWHSVAHHANEEVFDEVYNNFKNDVKIFSVYKLEVDLSSEKVHYYLLGCLSPGGKENFLVIEEYYHGPENLIHVEVNSFGWTMTTAKN